MVIIYHEFYVIGFSSERYISEQEHDHDVSEKLNDSGFDFLNH